MPPARRPRRRSRNARHATRRVPRRRRRFHTPFRHVKNVVAAPCRQPPRPKNACTPRFSMYAHHVASASRQKCRQRQFFLAALVVEPTDARVDARVRCEVDAPRDARCAGFAPTRDFQPLRMIAELA